MANFGFSSSTTRNLVGDWATGDQFPAGAPEVSIKFSALPFRIPDNPGLAETCHGFPQFPRQMLNDIILKKRKHIYQ
jgi:hypothetical protein